VGKIILDDRELTQTYDVPSVLELIAAVEEEHIDKGWIVTEVIINGDSLKDFTLEDGSLVSYDPASEVRIVTRELNAIMLASLQEFERYLSRLIPGLQHVAELFKQGKPDEANRLYVEAIDGIRVMIELIQGMSSSDALDFEDKRYSGHSLMDMAEGLKVAVQQLVEAQTNQNDAELAKLIEGDLVTQLKRWMEVLPLLRAEIERARK
jgi:hypothetical protein